MSARTIGGWQLASLVARTILVAGTMFPAWAEIPLDQRRSSYEDMSPDNKAMLAGTKLSAHHECVERVSLFPGTEIFQAETDREFCAASSTETVTQN
jgi:hypothetical protein